MSIEAVLVIAVIVFGYGLVSERLAGWSVSGPMVFTAAGVLLGPRGADLLAGQFEEGAVEALAEATLVLILFADATRIDLRVLRRQARLPARMLGIGLPLTVVFGTMIGLALFDLTLWEAALLAAVLAPTDAALGQAVVANPRVPVRIRQALNVESGLNDGLMVPVVTILVAVAASAAGLGSEAEAGAADWAGFAAAQIGYGLLAGVVAGCAGGWLLDRAVGRGWVEGAMRQLGTLAVAAGAFAGAHQLGGNGFVAAFVAGMLFGFVADHCHSAADFTEDEGQLLALITFLFFGALLLGPRLDQLTPTIAVYAVASLTVVRMVPVALSLFGVGLEPPTIGYLGWFGPRGLASILFGLFIVEEAALPGAETILTVMTWTVVASIMAHGLTAVPFAARYADWFHSMMSPAGATDAPVDEMAESEEVEEMRPRMGR